MKQSLLRNMLTQTASRSPASARSAIASAQTYIKPSSSALRHRSQNTLLTSYSPVQKREFHSLYSIRNNETPLGKVIHWLTYAVERDQNYPKNLESSHECIQRAIGFSKYYNVPLESVTDAYRRLKLPAEAKRQVFELYKNHMVFDTTLNTLATLGIQQYHSNYLEMDSTVFEKKVKQSVAKLKKCKGIEFDNVRDGLKQRIIKNKSLKNDDAKEVFSKIVMSSFMAWNHIERGKTKSDVIPGLGAGIGPRL